jgi:hypothetical protein
MDITHVTIDVKHALAQSSRAACVLELQIAELTSRNAHHTWHAIDVSAGDRRQNPKTTA